MTSPGYFERLYDESPDPWSLTASRYEHRKRALLMSALPQQRYAVGFEPGCAVGATTTELAERCNRLLAMDGASSAVQQAHRRVAAVAPQVMVVRGRVPDAWPAGRFDLIVLSELLYYLPTADRLRIAELVLETLVPGGDLVAVHWRHAFAEAATDGEVVHQELAERLAEPTFDRRLRHLEEHFQLDVYTRSPS